MVAIIIAVVITLVVVAPVTLAIANSIHKKQDAETISGAQEQARRIIDEAVTEAQAKKREALLEAKEDSLKTKNDLEKEMNAGQKYSALRIVFCRGRRTSTRKAMPSPEENGACMTVSRTLRRPEKKWPSSTQGGCRNSSESQD